MKGNTETAFGRENVMQKIKFWEVKDAHEESGGDVHKKVLISRENLRKIRNSSFCLEYF